MGFWLPVHGGAFWQRVFDDDADAVTLIDLHGRAGATAVVAPRVDGFEGSNLAFQRFGFQTKYFDGAVHLESEIGHVGSDDGH